MNSEGMIPEPEGLAKRMELLTLPPGLYLIDEPSTRKLLYDITADRMVDAFWQPAARIIEADQIPPGLLCMIREDGCGIYVSEMMVALASTCELIEDVS